MKILLEKIRGKNINKVNIDNFIYKIRIELIKVKGENNVVIQICAKGHRNWYYKLKNRSYIVSY